MKSGNSVFVAFRNDKPCGSAGASLAMMPERADGTSALPATLICLVIHLYIRHAICCLMRKVEKTTIQPTMTGQIASRCFLYSKIYRTHMAIKDIKGFSDKAKADNELKAKLIACQKVRELLTLAKESGFNFIEDEMYPPNEPQFTADQLSEKLGKALLRA